MTLGFLEWLIVAVVVVQVSRIALKPAFRRDMAALALLAIVGWTFALALAATGVWIMLRWPIVLHLVAGAGITGLCVAWWRARPDYGRSRGWPPGSLGINASLDAIEYRDFYLDQARLHGPVFKMSQFGRPVLCVVGLAQGRELLHQHADSIAGASLRYNRLVPRGLLRYMKSEDHKEEGPVFRNAFSALEYEPAERALRNACREMLASLSRDSRLTGLGVRPRDYFEQWLVRALARLLFGIEPGDPRIETLDRARHNLVLERLGGPRWRREMEEVFVSATTALREAARACGTPEGAAFGGSAIGALLADDPAAMDHDSRVRNLFVIYRLGVSDATALLDWVLAKVTESPEWQHNVRAVPRTSGAPQGSQPPDVASRVVLETLRMEQSEFIYRRIVRPIVVGGFSIPAGWLVRICVQESHRDAAIFPEPDRFNPDRFLGRTFGRGEYSPFGADNHGCLGRPLVQFLGRILVEELCHGYEWRVTRDGPLERGSRHRHHWRPSALRRIVMSPLGTEGPEHPAQRAGVHGASVGPLA